jgi:DNA helicase-2/ATP-dependent DNA helicase PcrA
MPELNKASLTRLARRISRAKDYCLSPEDDLSPISGDPEFPGQYRQYETRLREIGNVDFGDLILLPVRMLRAEPTVAARIRSRFRYILVDEYQDSNVAQYELLKELTDKDSYLCVVGDDDQSIYRFRGAEVRNILTFHESFPGTSVVRLEENYRSTEPILEVASAVVTHNSGRLGKRLWTQRSGGLQPKLVYLGDQDEEVEYCRRLVAREIAAGNGSSGSSSGSGAGSQGRSTAILYRTNAQSRLFETVFLREGIPYRIVGTLRFWEREEVRDVVAFLKFLANPKDEVSFRRIVNKPARGIGPATSEKLLAPAMEVDGDIVQGLHRAIPRLGTRSRKGAESFVKLVEELQRLIGSGDTLSAVVEAIMRDSGLAQYHAEQDEIAGSGKMQNLEELSNAASLYPDSEQGLQDFLETVELDSSRERDVAENEEEAPVTLITMHNTKGLEFDRVIVTGLEDGLFPRGGDEDPDELEEERRLFYVAITRAREELHLTSVRSRRIHGRTQELMPSRFLEEIPEELLEVEGGRRTAPVEDEPSWARGTAVYHDDYGQGVVVKSWHEGVHEIVLVRFETGQTARFLPEFATLEKISQDV